MNLYHLSTTLVPCLRISLVFYATKRGTGRLVVKNITVGSIAKAEAEKSHEEQIQALGASLQRLPRVHLYVLDTLVRHLKT